MENSYATGANFVHNLIVTAPEPAEGEDLDEWALDHLMRHTGEGPQFANVEGLYEVEVIACDAWPELVGITVSAQG